MKKSLFALAIAAAIMPAYANAVEPSYCPPKSCTDKVKKELEFQEFVDSQWGQKMTVATGLKLNAKSSSLGSNLRLMKFGRYIEKISIPEKRKENVNYVFYDDNTIWAWEFSTSRGGCEIPKGATSENLIKCEYSEILSKVASELKKAEDAKRAYVVGIATGTIKTKPAEYSKKIAAFNDAISTLSNAKTKLDNGSFTFGDKDKIEKFI